MADVKITPTDHGPYQVVGTVRLVDADGNAWEIKDTVWLCRCGHSERKPFCDGSHKKNNFSAETRAPNAV